VDAILQRFLTTWAHRYLTGLDDVAVRDPELSGRLARELDDLAEAKTITHRSELLLSGLQVEGALHTHDGVSLRPLSEVERGAWQLHRSDLMSDDLGDDPDFVVPIAHSFFNPKVMLSTTTTRSPDQLRDESQLCIKVALALIMTGFDIGSTGSMARMDQPRWAMVGTSFTPVPILERALVDAKSISQEQFASAVDLATKMPDLGADESSREAIVLWRLLRGCGAVTGGFLDHAISLEAALLGGTKLALAYKFRLYGALFLSNERDPKTTFAQLKRVYDVRSSLVHGTPIKAGDRQTAEADAADLAKAVAKRCLESGWPDTASLDEMALGIDLA
jgi:hypothetical protein